MICMYTYYDLSKYIFIYHNLYVIIKWHISINCAIFIIILVIILITILSCIVYAIVTLITQVYLYINIVITYFIILMHILHTF